MLQIAHLENFEIIPMHTCSFTHRAKYEVVIFQMHLQFKNLHICLIAAWIRNRFWFCIEPLPGEEAACRRSNQSPAVGLQESAHSTAQVRLEGQKRQNSFHRCPCLHRTNEVVLCR